QLQAVDSRHLVVHDQAIRVAPGRRAEQRGPAAEGTDVESLRLQQESQRRQDVVIIVHDVDHRLPAQGIGFGTVGRAVTDIDHPGTIVRFAANKLTWLNKTWLNNTWLHNTC